MAPWIDARTHDLDGTSLLGRVAERNPVWHLKIAEWDDLRDRHPSHALVGNVDLVIIRLDDQVSVLNGRCLHRGTQ